MPKSYLSEETLFLSKLISTPVQVGLLTSPPSGPYNSGIVQPGAGYSLQVIYLLKTGIMCASNSYAVTWTATGPWPAAEYFAIYDMGGSLLYWGQLQTPVASNSGGPVSIPIGGIFIDWNNSCPNYNPNFGRPATINAPVGTVPVDFRFSMLDGSYIPATSITLPSPHKPLRPTNYNTFNLVTVISGSPNGLMKYQRMLDGTRGTSTCFTVSTPDGLAF